VRTTTIQEQRMPDQTPVQFVLCCGARNRLEGWSVMRPDDNRRARIGGEKEAIGIVSKPIQSLLAPLQCGPPFLAAVARNARAAVPDVPGLKAPDTLQFDSISTTLSSGIWSHWLI
jgi:hypothetical protein